MMPYREQIEQAAAEQAVDLLAYYDGPDEVREHLVSIIPSVAVQDGKLCGCTAITYRQDLSEHQWNALFRDIAGQYSDGWGEGFEQRDIEVDGGILNVHFWQPDGFEMVPIAVSSAEQTVPERPRMELAGHDGNIFAILGRAAKLLRENGQNAASVEMRRRVTHCDNYYKALGIISECALPGFVDSKNEEKTERNAGYLVVSHSGGGMLRQGTRKGIRRTPANRGMRAHRVVKGLDISEDVCHGMCP